MFDGFDPERVQNMDSEEQRLFDNTKKAFYESDLSILEGRREDRCLEELCKAIDTAKTLRTKLRGESMSARDNKSRFMEFLELDIPSKEEGGMKVMLRDSRTGKDVEYSFAGLVYAIRCMVHENENLNAAERPEYHILIDWTMSNGSFGRVEDGQLVCNGNFLAGRLRQVLAKFIMGLDSFISIKHGKFAVSTMPPLGSIRPAKIG